MVVDSSLTTEAHIFLLQLKSSNVHLCNHSIDSRDASSSYDDERLFGSGQ